MKAFKTWSTLALLAALAAGCSTTTGGGGGGPAANPSSAPPKEYLGEATPPYPAGPATAGTLSEEVKFDTADVPFKDPVTDSDIASGNFVPGNWVAGNGVYMQQDPGSTTKLSIRQYTGTPGTHYRVEVTGWTYRVFTGDPKNDQGVIVLMPYYKDTTHYVICSASPQLAESWACDGQVPGGTWPTANRLTSGSYPARTVGSAFTWTADVDTVAHTIQVYLNGQRQSPTAVSNALMDGNGGIALASNGDQVKYTNFRVYRLTGSTTPAPTPTATPAPTRTPTPTATPAPTRTPAPAPAPTEPPAPDATL